MKELIIFSIMCAITGFVIALAMALIGSIIFMPWLT
jgi:hypothetical protein